MFGNPKESPWRYLVRLYNSPRIKKIVDTERGDYYLSEKKYYADNLKALEDWESLKKDMPDLFDDEYKQMLEKLNNHFKEDYRDPIDVILRTRLNMNVNEEDRTSSVLGWTNINKPEIRVFPYKHVSTKDHSLPATVVHELSHQIFPYTAEKAFDYGNKESYFKKSSLGLYEKTDNESINYYASPTEKLARINELRWVLDKRGLYDATKRDFTEQDYINMIKANDPEINRILEDLRTGSLKQLGDKAVTLPKEEERENIIRLMNELAQNKSNNSSLIKYAQKGNKIDPPTRQDSLDLLNNTKALEKYYAKYAKEIYPYDGDKEQLKFEIDRDKNNVVTSIRKGNKSTLMKVGNITYMAGFINPNEYIKNIDNNKVLKRESAYPVMDLRSPMQLIDKRIVPKEKLTLNNIDKEDPIMGDVVSLYKYPQLQVTPFDMLTRDQQIERQKKYGRNKGEPDLLNSKKMPVSTKPVLKLKDIKDKNSNIESYTTTDQKDPRIK